MAEKIPESEKLNAAYAAFKTDVGPEKYADVLQALEDAIVAKGCAFEPGRTAESAELILQGKIEWSTMNTPAGPCLSIFTSEEQAQRHDAAFVMTIRIEAFVGYFESHPELAGVILNPYDENGGLPIQRAHMELVIRNARAKTDPHSAMKDLMSEVLFDLWGNAKGIPFPMLTVNEEINALGGDPFQLVKPIFDSWDETFKRGYKVDTQDEYLRCVITSSLEVGMISGVMTKIGLETFEGKTPYEWLQEESDDWDDEEESATIVRCLGYSDPDWVRSRDLREAMTKNVETYLEIFEARVAQIWNCSTKEETQRILLDDIGVVAVGMVLFGVGWGAALFYEKQGPDAVEKIRSLQEKYLQEGYPGVNDDNEGATYAT